MATEKLRNRAQTRSGEAETLEVGSSPGRGPCDRLDEVRKRSGAERRDSVCAPAGGGALPSHLSAARRLRALTRPIPVPRFVDGLLWKALFLRTLPELPLSVPLCPIHFLQSSGPYLPPNLRGRTLAKALVAAHLSNARRLRALMSRDQGVRPADELPSETSAPLPPSCLCASAPLRPTPLLCVSASC